MKRLFLAAAVLATAACGDGMGNPISPDGARPGLHHGPTSPKYTIFTTQEPASYLSASPGWEVATRFKVSQPGRIVGFRFWRAPGETGTNRAKLWTDGGTRVSSKDFPSGGSGWQTVYLSGSSHVRIPANTYYRVSVNTNAYQAKTYRDQPFSLTNGSITGDFSYYGQPTGSMPTQGSYSWFFVDVIFIPDGPLPNLYIASIIHSASGPSVTIRVCNNGAAFADASTTQMEHWVGYNHGIQELATPGLAAGACADVSTDALDGTDGLTHSYYVWADEDDVVYESNEADNYAQREGVS